MLHSNLSKDTFATEAWNSGGKKKVTALFSFCFFGALLRSNKYVSLSLSLLRRCHHLTSLFSLHFSFDNQEWTQKDVYQTGEHLSTPPLSPNHAFHTSILRSSFLLQQIIIQGFKSYKDQTITEPFSGQHNVIGKHAYRSQCNPSGLMRFHL